MTPDSPDVEQLDRENLDRLVMVGGDLAYLVGLPQDRLLTHTEVRLAASVLRRLLVEGELLKVWKLMNSAEAAEPTFDVPDLDEQLGKIPDSWVRFGWAGGARPPGASHRGFILLRVPSTEWRGHSSPVEFIKARGLDLNVERRPMRIGEWLNSTSAAIGTEDEGLHRINRRAMLKYIANGRGGVHFDPQRRFAKGRGKKAAQKQAQLLGHGLLRVGHLSGPEFEICSMIEPLTGTSSVREIIDEAEARAPEDFAGDPAELKFWSGLQEADGTGWATGRVGESS